MGSFAERETATWRGSLLAHRNDHAALMRFLVATGIKVPDNEEDMLWLTMTANFGRSNGGVFGGAAATAADAKARVADKGDDAQPGAFFAEMNAQGAGNNPFAQSSKSWGGWCAGAGAGEYQFKRSDAAEIEDVASADDLRRKLVDTGYYTQEACTAIREAAGHLNTVLRNRCTFQKVATDAEILHRRTSTGDDTIGTRRFETASTDPATFYSYSTKGPSQSGVAATAAYHELADFCGDSPGSFRLMNKDGAMSKCLTKKEVEAWGKGTKMRPAEVFSRLEERRAGRSKTGGPVARCSFITVGGWALFGM